MRFEDGTGGQWRSRKDVNPLQMGLFEDSSGHQS
jgi:hypothetical protein